MEWKDYDLAEGLRKLAYDHGYSTRNQFRLIEAESGVTLKEANDLEDIKIIKLDQYPRVHTRIFQMWYLRGFPALWIEN